MGWLNEDCTHEGYEIGFVKGEFGTLRKLDSADTLNRSDVIALSAECSCGWRSSRWTPRGGSAEWMPCCVLPHPADEEKAHQLWKAHATDIERASV